MKLAKSRDAARTRESIIAAAQRKFTELGYDRAGVREIADLAGVNVALTNRYFGSKEGLFREAILPHLTLDQLLDIPADQLAEKMSSYMVTKERPADGFDPLLAVLRSTGSEVVADAIKVAFETQVIRRLSGVIEKQHAEQRAALLVALLLGFHALNSIICVEQFREADETALAKLLVDAIKQQLHDVH